MRAIVITIGDELLNGTTVDTNSAFLGRELGNIGIQLFEKLAISDKKEHIIDSLERYVGKADLILFTGGLGPTKDDITKQTLCEYFGGTLVRDASVLAGIEKAFARRGLTMTDRNSDQALVPDVCTVVPNAYGTAPGMLFEQNGSLVFSMPGVPFEMRSMFAEQVIPILQQRLELPVIVNRHLMTSGIGESWLADRIADLEEALPPHITLAYLPSPGVVKLRLTGRGTDSRKLQEEVDAQVQLFAERLGKHVYGYDEETLMASIGRRLMALNKTLSLAESCTGGNIGKLITSIPGSSAYFMGSVVSYDNSVKEKVLGVSRATLDTHGAVSEETVQEMLSGILRITGTHYAIAVSGVAGPGGGTEDKPVGTVYIGVAGPSVTEIKRYTFGQKRDTNIEYSSMYALHHLRSMLDADLEKQGISA